MSAAFPERWYVSYALLGAAAAGLGPILLPLTVGAHATATDVGLVMGALNAGGLVGPLAGDLADRRGGQALLFAGGCLMVAAGAAAFSYVDSSLAYMGLALLQGAGTAVAATVASLLVVERHAREEWDGRLASLQASYGAGQVAGLVGAGVIGAASLVAGLRVAALLAGAGGVSALLLVRSVPGPVGARPVAAHASRVPGASAVAAQGHSHRMMLQGLRRLRDAEDSSFGRFLIAWFVTFGSVAAIFSLYPVLMARVFGVSPAVSSVVFGAAAAVGLGLYAPAGRWSEKAGASRVLRAGLWTRVVAAAALWLLAAVHPHGGAWLALLSFCAIVLAWSLLSVSATIITAQLARIGEGPAMGLFNAATALAAVAGSVVGGVVAGRYGYAGVPAVATLGIVIGLAMTIGFERRERTTELRNAGGSS